MIKLEFQYQKTWLVVISVRRFWDFRRIVFFCVLNVMQMDVYIMNKCLFATCMNMRCIFWKAFAQRGVLLFGVLSSSQTSSQRMSLLKK